METPCVKICTLDAEQRNCIGCGRSVEQIGRWTSYSDAERAEIIQNLQTRRDATTREAEKHAMVSCPRCHALFACKANSPTRCDCMDLRFTKEQLARIMEVGNGECFCINCLKELAS